MSTTSYFMPDGLYDYLRRTGVREPGLLERLREETAQLPGGGMQISPELGQFLTLLVEISGANKALELGTFTGYSAICIARALGPEGQLICCDINEDAHILARRYWAEAGISDRVDLRVGECNDSLDDLFDEGQEGTFDFAFIDADKPGYAHYFECCLKLLRPGGVMVFDNVFMGGTVTESNPSGKYTASVQAFNETLLSDERVTVSMLPVGDGITIARIR